MGGATILRVGVQILLRVKRAENFWGLYSDICHYGGVQQLQREAYGEPIGQHVLLVVPVNL